jgi:hypothetical protein
VLEASPSMRIAYRRLRSLFPAELRLSAANR